MNILVFAHDAYLYGASQSLLTVLNGIKKKTDRKILVLLPFSGKLENELRAAEIDYKIISFPRCVEFNYASIPPLEKLKKIYDYYLNLFYIIRPLKKIITEFKADVIYTNTSVVSVGYKVAKRMRIPHVWHVREFGDPVFNFKYYPGRLRVAKLIRASEKSIFVSNALKNHWMANNPGRHAVVYNGIVEVNNTTVNSFRTFPKQNFKIGLIGAVVPGKEQHTAIEAFAGLVQIVPNCELHFYGDPNTIYLNGLKKVISKLQLEDKIVFNSFTSDKKLIYKDLDLVLNCTKLEGFGRTIVEAMTYGIPVIANGSGGVLEIIDDKINGLLYDGSIDGLKNKMIKLLTDKKLYELLSGNGLRKAEMFGVETYVDAVDKIMYDAYANYRKN